ncbi:MAG: hypothetical protein L0J17_16000 [Brevibacterium sp.]|nr:hypothetical protein [Brevibacterium sp.]MDN6529909.1 hypothetical protein [Brevibacterium sp.]MDN6748525.1 hypothetical protein [Brevibacterium sp.]
MSGQTPSQRYAGLAANFGTSAYARQDAPATREQKAKLSSLEASQMSAKTVGGEPVTFGAHLGTGKLRTHRRSQRHDRELLVPDPPFGYRGRVEDLRGVTAR